MKTRGLFAILLLLLAIVAARFWLGLRSETKLVHASPELPREVLAAQWQAFMNGGELQGRAEAEFPLRKMRLRWEKKLDADVAGAPIVARHTVYVSAKNCLYALDLRTGALKWFFSTEGHASAAPLFAGGSIFFGDQDGFFYSVAEEGGREEWEFEAKGEIHSPANFAVTPAGTLLLFGAFDHNFYCLAAEDGRLVWSFPTDSWTYASPAVAGSLAFCGGCDSKLRALDLQTGREKWNVSLNGNLDMAASPVCSAGRVYVASFEGKVACIKISDGTEVWRREIKDESFNGSPALAAGKLILAGQKTAVYALDPATSETLWTFPSRDGFDASPAVSGGGVYLPGNDGKLHVLDIQNGREAWSFMVGASLPFAPALAEGCVVFCDSDNTVYCLEY
jgi:outer membrane protein assembly factor BamB